MKKSVSIFLCVLMVAFTLCSCKITKGDMDDESTTEREKKEIVYVTDENGEYVTEKNGKRKTEIADSSADNKDKSTKKDDREEETIAVNVTDKEGNTVTEKDGKNKTEYKKVSDLEKELENQMENAEKSTSKSKTQVIISESQNGATSADKTIMKTVVEPILKKGNYTVKGKIKAEGQTMTATIAFRNAKDYYFDVSMMGISVVMFSNAGKYYMAVPTMKAYTEVPSDDMADLGIGDIADSLKEKDAKFIKSYTVKEGNKTYTCEEFKTSGGTAKYYFDADKNWKRMELADTEGPAIVWDISSFSKTVDDKLFTLDKSWKKSSELADMF